MVYADKADDYAIKFYHSTGATGEKVILLIIELI